MQSETAQESKKPTLIPSPKRITPDGPAPLANSLDWIRNRLATARTTSPEEERLIREANEKLERDNAEKQLQSRVARSKLPPLHWEKPINIPALGDHPWATAYRRIAAHVVKPGATVLMLGNCGSGKTHMAVEIARGIITAGNPISGYVVYTTADQMADDLRDASCNQERSLRTAIERYTNATLLIIDEIDKRSETVWGEAKLLRVLDERYQYLRRTVVIGNIVPDALARSLGPSASDRMRETALLIEATWGSFRRLARVSP